MKRVLLFLGTNLLVGTMLFIVTSALGLQGFFSSKGINYPILIVSSVIYGFAGAFISLAISRWVAKWTMGVKLVDPTAPGSGGLLAREVHELARKAGLKHMPEVGIYESDEMNAFATGPSQKR